MAEVHGSSNQTIQINLERDVYSLMCAPRVLSMDYTGIYVHKSGSLDQDEIKSFENLDWKNNRLLAPKLNGTSFGEYELTVGMINEKHIDTREKLDTLFSRDFTEGYAVEELTVSKVNRITLEEALQRLTVTISCNMDYYLSNSDEMEKDLNRKLENLDPKNEEMMRELEVELLYEQAVKIFGEEGKDVDGENADTKGDKKIGQPALTFKEFHLLFSDGNATLATAKRGSHYVLFYHSTS